MNTLQAEVSVFLQGPLNQQATAMETNLTLHLPLSDPYPNLGYQHTNNISPGEITTQVLNQSGSNAIVDWVFLELRHQNTPDDVVATRSALLTASGLVVDLDGSSPVTFFCVTPGDYYLTVKHRNHIGVMTALPVTFTN